MRRSLRLTAIVLLVALVALEPIRSGDAMTEAGSPAVLPALVQSHSEMLAKVSSDAEARAFFISTVGPVLGLQDVVGTLNAKAIPAKLAIELLVPDITESARRLVAALAVWQWAETALPGQFPEQTRIEWLQASGGAPSLPAMLQQLRQTSRTDADPSGQQDPAIEREWSRVMHRLAIEASQTATSEWWQLKTWKDRVRTIRGQTRLCGTWQWTVHNHQQHHQEQKFALIFPPPGPNRSAAQGLVETVVLGENVYLRWEINGQIQEDSLQFGKEGQKLEGTFVNSQGGWGSITGKRTSDCKP